MVSPVQTRLLSAFTNIQTTRSVSQPSLRFGSTEGTPPAGGDVFFRQADDYPGIRKPPVVSPIRNIVPQALPQLQQARSLAELMTVLDRRTGYLTGLQNGICPDRSLDGPIELSYPDGPTVTVDLTVPPQVADTHVLHKVLCGGGNSEWDRPYEYTAVPEAIAGKVPVYATETGGMGFSMNHLMDLLHGQPQTPSIISFGNRPSVAVTVENTDGHVVRFTIDTNVTHGKGVSDDKPPVRIVNFSVTQATFLGPDEVPPEGGRGVLFENVPNLPPNVPKGSRIMLQEVEMAPRDQQQVVADTLNQLYHHVPGAMLQGTKWPVNVDRKIEPGDAKSGHNYVYPRELDSLVFQYRYGMGHYAPEKKY